MTYRLVSTLMEVDRFIGAMAEICAGMEKTEKMKTLSQMIFNTQSALKRIAMDIDELLDLLYEQVKQ